MSRQAIENVAEQGLACVLTMELEVVFISFSIKKNLKNCSIPLRKGYPDNNIDQCTNGKSISHSELHHSV